MKIGVTGGIGSGKSYVCRMIEAMGYPVYYTDDEAKRLMLSHDTIRTSLVSLLGKDVYLPSGDINKPLLAKYLFAGKDNADRINSIVHPVVKSDFLHWAELQDSAHVFMECAILFESGFDSVVDFKWIVTAPEDVRLARAMTRDQASESQIRDRMKSQMAESDKVRLADRCIINDGQSDVYNQLRALIDEL